MYLEENIGYNLNSPISNLLPAHTNSDGYFVLKS